MWIIYDIILYEERSEGVGKLHDLFMDTHDYCFPCRRGRYIHSRSYMVCPRGGGVYRTFRV